MRDPVCGMSVGESALKVSGYPDYGFCSEHCRQSFSENPEQYLGDVQSEGVQTEDDDEAGEEDPEMSTQVESVYLSVEGMTCASCVATVERTLAAVPAVVDARVNFAAEEATVHIVGGEVEVSELVAAVEAAGYGAQPVEEDADGDAEPE